MTKRGDSPLPPPLGLCLKCIDNIIRGADDDNRFEAKLADGSILLAWWCPHSCAGAHLILREDREPRWIIEAPISLQEFGDQMRRLPMLLAGAQAAMMDHDGNVETPSSLN